MAEHNLKDENLPALGKLLTWVDKPGSANKIFWALAVLCGLLFVLDWTYEKHAYVKIADIPGFYGVYGFISFCLVIFGAKTLRYFVMRPENYYGDKAIDRETYPESQTEQLPYDGEGK